MSNLDKNYEKEKKKYKRLTYIIISLFLVSAAIAIIGYFLHNNNIFVFFLALTILSSLIFVILGTERYEMSNRFKLIHEWTLYSPIEEMI